MTEFLQMGGYGQFVWSSYGVALLVLAGLTLHAVRRNARVRAELVRVEARANRRKEGRDDR